MDEKVKPEGNANCSHSESNDGMMEDAASMGSAGGNPGPGNPDEVTKSDLNLQNEPKDGALISESETVNGGNSSKNETNNNEDTSMVETESGTSTTRTHDAHDTPIATAPMISKEEEGMDLGMNKMVPKAHTNTALIIKNENGTDTPMEGDNEDLEPRNSNDCSSKSETETVNATHYNCNASAGATCIKSEHLELKHEHSTTQKGAPTPARSEAVKIESEQVMVKNESAASHAQDGNQAQMATVKSEDLSSDSKNEDSTTLLNPSTQSSQTAAVKSESEEVEPKTELSNSASQHNAPTKTAAVQKDEEEEEENEEEIMDEDEWREEIKDILDDIDRKGDFFVGREMTDYIPRFSPQIAIDGMEDGEQLTYPLMDYQAKRLRSFAEKAPFGKGLDTVLDESVRKAWQIDADKVKFCDSHRWQTALRRIVSDCTASLGMVAAQQENVRANLYKLLLYEPGGHFKKHRDTEKEPGMFGTLIIQMPSKFTGGALVIEHAGEKKTLDFSMNSNEGFYATAFYADCEHELLPVQDGWRLCLAYNLVMHPSSMQQLPSACALTAQTRRLRTLASQWSNLFQHTHGYLLEHDYTETNLHFANLKGRDKEVANLLRGSRDVNGNPLFVVCLMLISKHDTGSPSYDGYRRGYDSESDEGDHDMDEVHDSEVDTDYWIGPDDTQMKNFRLDFDLEESLLTDEDTDEIFGDDPSRQEYESYTGNAGPTLEYWYYRGAVVFWPRVMNMGIMKSAGVSYMLSYLKVAPQSEKLTICEHLVNLLEGKKLRISPAILSGISTCNDSKLLSRALKSCDRLPDSAFVRELANICISKSSWIENDILELVTKTAGAMKTSQWESDPVVYALEFLNAIKASVSNPFTNAVKQCIATGALGSRKAAQSMVSAHVDEIAKISFEIGGDIFQCFCNAVKLNTTKLSSVLKCLIALGDVAVQNSLVVELAKIRAKALRLETKGGVPAFSWRQPNANFPASGSQSYSVNSFLRGELQSETFYGFNNVQHARNWASKYFGYGSGPGYSAIATPGGRGSSAHVTVIKTKDANEKIIEVHNLKRKELRMLKKIFKDNLEMPSGQNRRKQDSDDGPAPKKAREVVELD